MSNGKKVSNEYFYLLNRIIFFERLNKIFMECYKDFFGRLINIFEDLTYTLRAHNCLQLKNQSKKNEIKRI